MGEPLEHGERGNSFVGRISKVSRDCTLNNYPALNGFRAYVRGNRSGARSPFSCSVVILVTSASKSTADKSLHTPLSRNAKSRWTEFSRSPGSISRQHPTALPLDRDHCSGIVILPLFLAAEASSMRAEAEWWEPLRGCAAQAYGLRDSVNLHSKDAANLSESYSTSVFCKAPSSLKTT